MDLDVTIFFQFALLGLLMALLGPTFFTPLLRLIEQRHEKIHGTRVDASRLENAARADQNTYEERLSQARRQMQSDREKMRGEGRDEARRLVTDMRRQIAATMAASRTQVDAAERAAQRTLQADVQGLAHKLVQKLTQPGASS